MTIDDFLDGLGGPDLEGDIPSESEFYVDVAQTFHARFERSWAGDSELDDLAFEGYKRWCDKEKLLVDALRWLLSRDGRSFRALLWIAEWTTQHPQLPWPGINSLASISCYLWNQCPAGYSDEQLVAQFDRYCGDKGLSVNAWQCLRSIAHRRPDIKSRYPENPPKRVLGIEDESEE